MRKQAEAEEESKRIKEEEEAAKAAEESQKRIEETAFDQQTTVVVPVRDETAVSPEKVVKLADKKAKSRDEERDEKRHGREELHVATKGAGRRRKSQKLERLFKPLRAINMVLKNQRHRSLRKLISLKVLPYLIWRKRCQ